MNACHRFNSSKMEIIPRVLLLCVGFILLSYPTYAGQITASLHTHSVDEQRPVVSVNFKDKPLERVLHELARKVNAGVSYETEALPDKKVTYRAKNTSIFIVLEAVLKGTGLHATVSVDRKVIMIKKEPIAPITQQETILGTVTDAKTGETLPGVNIAVKGTTAGTSTDTNGKYELSVENLQDTLLFSYVGYEQQEVPIKGRTSIDVSLKQATQSLKEMVVTGFGNEEKEQFTGSVGSVSGESIENQTVSTVTQGLQGKISGVNVTTQSGSPGGQVQINIRGTSSISLSTEPLVVIDGIPIKSGRTNPNSNNTSLGILSNLSSDNVKSISVLKGPSATSLYGARGSNGVVVIETKEGSLNQKTIISVSAQAGLEGRATSGPKVLNAKQWNELYMDASLNAGIPASNINSPWDGHTDTNWKKLVQKDHPITQQYSISASGGNDKATYNASLGYNKDPGIILVQGFERYNSRLNFGYDLTDRVHFSNKISVSFVKQSGASEGENWYGSPVVGQYEVAPIYPVYTSNGDFNSIATSSIRNPVFAANEQINNKRQNQILENLSVKIDVAKNLAYSSNLGGQFLHTELKDYISPKFDREGLGSVSQSYIRNFNYTWNNIIDYKLNLNGVNNFGIKLVQQAHIENYYTNGVSAQNFPTSGLSNASSAGTPLSTSASADDWANLAFFGRLHYGFQDKISLNGSYRYEGNTKFVPKNRWGGFYSIGAKWNIMNQSFLKDAKDWLSLLSLSVDYGTTGNANIDVNKYQNLVTYGQSYGQDAAAAIELGSDNLTWEKDKTIEASIDLGFNDDKYSISATFFRKKSNGLLLDVPLSRATGFASQLRNVGKLRNQGVELSLNANIIQNKNILWSLSGNYTHVKSTVLSMPTDALGQPIIVRSLDRGFAQSDLRYIAAEGYPVDTWFMRSWAGVDPENGKPLWYQGEGSERTTTSNYGEADSYSQGVSAHPTGYGSFNTHLEVKNVFLDASVNYSYGNKVYDKWGLYFLSDGSVSQRRNQFLSAYTDRWKKPGDHAKNPQIIKGGNNNSDQTSSRYLHDGSYVRLRTVRLGYNFPNSVLSSLELSSLSIYVVGQNLLTHTFDEDLGYDPQVNSAGLLSFYASALKSFSMGIKFQF